MFASTDESDKQISNTATNDGGGGLGGISGHHYTKRAEPFPLPTLSTRIIVSFASVLVVGVGGAVWGLLSSVVSGGCCGSWPWPPSFCEGGWCPSVAHTLCSGSGMNLQAASAQV